jgi:hypothetical protein
VIQGHRNPFGKALRDYTIAELDFVLEMAAIDNPDQYTFSRGGTPAGRSDAPVAMAGWMSVLKEPLLQRYLERVGVAQGIRAVAAWKAKQTGGLKPGFSRAGKPTDKVP